MSIPTEAIERVAEFARQYRMRLDVPADGKIYTVWIDPNAEEATLNLNDLEALTAVAVTGMEDVLTAHLQHYTAAPYAVCTCDKKARTYAAHAAHVAEALEAAGFGNLHDAWNAGYTVGNAHNGRRDANPYPKVNET